MARVFLDTLIFLKQNAPLKLITNKVILEATTIKTIDRCKEMDISMSLYPTQTVTNSSLITNCTEDPTHYCYPYSWWAGLKTKPELWLTRTGREEAGERRRAARTTVLIGLYSNSVTGVVWKKKKNSPRVGKRTHRAVCQEKAAPSSRNGFPCRFPSK